MINDSVENISATPEDAARVARVGEKTLRRWMKQPQFDESVNVLPWDAQNSSRAWTAIIRGELSPPNPTPSKPVGGEVG